MSRATVDLPHPDSPTSDSVSPRLMVNDTPSTARSSVRGAPSITRFNQGRDTSKSFARSLTSRSVSATHLVLCMQPARCHRVSRGHHSRSLDAAAFEHLRAARVASTAGRYLIEPPHPPFHLHQARLSLPHHPLPHH